MDLSGLHLLLTYQCTLECDHCFVWGSPRQSGTMRLEHIERILDEARSVETVKWIYFEGGEPFLYYPVLVRGVAEAAIRGFSVGVVTNGYWATSREDAIEWLLPLAGKVADLSISSDLYHWDQRIGEQARNASEAAERLSIPAVLISIAPAERSDAAPPRGQLVGGESGVMYHGRAAQKLAPIALKLRKPDAPGSDWEAFETCPHEDLREPGRLHVDPFGEVHVCHGISIGNLYETSLAEICCAYDPDSHPVVGPLLAGGPAELARRYGVVQTGPYADACHLCDATRRSLRRRFPDVLRPGQMYGDAEEPGSGKTQPW
ncbi:MAG: radical SAM protein [Acidobacteriota bacterium]|jgi:hypothetical protein